MDHALEFASPLLLNAFRFSLAAIALGIWVHTRRVSIAVTWPWGLLLGLLMTMGFGLQTYGMERISPARSAFLTATYVLFTPAIEWIVFSKRPSASMVGRALLAFSGIAILSGAAGWSFDPTTLRGDLLTLGSAAAFAAHIVFLARALRTHGPLPLLYTQVVACSALLWIGAFTIEVRRVEFTAGFVSAIVFLAIVATVLVLGLQNYGQRRTTATSAAIYFATEPLWAAVFSVLVGHRLEPREWIGGALIVASLLPWSRTRRSRDR